jgi:hypothetical protein
MACSCCSRADPLDEDGKLLPQNMMDILASAGQPNREVFFTDYTDQSLVIDDSDLDIDLDTDPEDSPELNMSTVFAPKTVSCGVCFGTGFVGGYRLHSGTRIVVDARNIVGHNMIMDTGTPVRLQACAGSYLEQRILIPRGSDRVDVLRAYDNQDRLTAVRFMIDGTPVSEETLLNYADGFAHTLRIEFDKTMSFTHFELQVGYSELYIDYSRYTNTTQNTLYKQLGDFTIVIPPVVHDDLKGSITVESTEGLMYRISEMSRNNNFDGSPLFLECSARAVQPYELAYALPRYGKTRPKTDVATGATPRRSYL